MKKLNQLWVIEEDESLPTFYSLHTSLLASFSSLPVAEYTLASMETMTIARPPELVLFHAALTSIDHLRRFVWLRSLLPLSSIIVVSHHLDQDLCLLALEAGADDCTLPEQLTLPYLQRMVVLGLRRYQTETELNHNREQLLACIQNTPNVAVQWYNSDSKVLFWNHASERIFGWTAEEAVGRSIDELIVMPENKFFWRNKIRHLANTASSYGPEEWSFRYKDGREGCCISTLVPIPSFDLEPWFVCMDVEITDRKKAEEELRQSEERYRKLFNRASDAIFINDMEGRFLDMNEKACELTGYSSTELQHMSLEDLYTVDELQERPIMWPELIRGERTRVDRYMRRANNEIIPIEITAQMFTEGRIMAIVRDVSDRRKAAEAIAQSQRQLELIYNTTSDVIFLIDIEEGPAFRFSSINKSFAAVTGLAAEAIVGRPVNEIIPEPSLSLVLKKYDEAINTGKLVTWEEVTRYPTGVKTGIVSVMPVLDKAGRCTQLVGTVHDITSRKLAEEAVLMSEEKYRSLIEQLADTITIFKEDGTILDVNSSATQLLQYTKEEFQHMRLTDLLAPSELAHNPLDFGLLASGQSTIKQRRMRRKDGSEVQTEMHAKRLFDGFFLASLRDLTERMEVQHQVEREKELSDSIINSLPGLFYLFTEEGAYLRWNRQQEIISGYSPDEIRQMPPLAFIAAADREAVKKAIADTFVNGQAALEAHLLTKTGESIPYYFTGRAVLYQDKRCLLGTGIDLSALKNLEKELTLQKIREQKKVMQAMLDAEEKEKNKLGLELHDNVNQILSVVRMYLAILNSPDKLEEVTLDKAIALLNSAIDEIRQLSHSLAISYKFETGVASTLRAMVNNVSLARDFELSMELSPDLDEQTNSHQKLALYRIVQEQLNNISKHAAANRVDISVDVNAKAVLMTIADNGKGFDPDVEKNGLGLNNIVTRAEALGGTALIFSAPGHGTRLSVTLPHSPKNK